jgi:threonine dehydrogenase-like Zn-dependent dehydrogenase
MALSRRAWEIVSPGVGRIVKEPIDMPGRGEVIVQAEWGAVSPGSESLAFAGRLPDELALDDTQASLGGSASYPLRYGYILTGRVAFCGDGVDTDVWLGRRVFAFHPHASHAVVPVQGLLPVPDEVVPEEAPLYANTETAVSLHWDGAILPGETVLVTGLGIVGLLVTAIAMERGAGCVVAVDPDADRRRWAREYFAALAGSEAGFPGAAGRTLAPHIVASIDEARAVVAEATTAYRGVYEGFDVAFEVSGAAPVLDDVVGVVAFGGRIVVGSWYGNVPAPLHLGGRFHRGRVRLISSQVSTIPLTVAGRVDYERRTRIAWAILQRIGVGRIPRRTVSLSDLPEFFHDLAAGARPEPWVMVRY